MEVGYLEKASRYLEVLHGTPGIRDAMDERTRAFPRDGPFLDCGAQSEIEVRNLGIGPSDPGGAGCATFMIVNGTDN